MAADVEECGESEVFLWCRKEQERSSDWRVSEANTLTSELQGNAAFLECWALRYRISLALKEYGKHYSIKANA